MFKTIVAAAVLIFSADTFSSTTRSVGDVVLPATNSNFTTIFHDQFSHVSVAQSTHLRVGNVSFANFRIVRINAKDEYPVTFKGNILTDCSLRHPVSSKSQIISFLRNGTQVHIPMPQTVLFDVAINVPDSTTAIFLFFCRERNRR